MGTRRSRSSSANAQRGFGDVGRVRTGAGARRALPFGTLAGGIAKSWCFGKSTAATLSLRLTWPS